MNRFRRFSASALLPAFLAFFAAFVFFASCSSVEENHPAAPETGETAPADESAGEPEYGGGEGYAEPRPRSESLDEMTVVFSKADVELDFRKSYIASEAQLFTALYEGLFSYHPLTMEPIAASAAKWEISEDKKQWTFTIRTEARFQNGDTVRAEDFRASWLSLLEPSRNSPYSSFFDIIEGAREYRLGEGSRERVGISAPAEKTLVVRLNSPAAFFPAMLCHHSFSPVHPSMLNEENWVFPVSNGPFFVEEIDGGHILLAKNPFYWDRRGVKLNKLTVKFAEDGMDAAAMWNSGEARWILGEVDVPALTDRGGIEVNALFATHYYYIRSVNKPWDDPRLRRSLAIVLPWEKIREGYALPAKTLIYPIPDYPELEGLENTDAEEAKRLLSEAGYEGGKGLPELRIRITPSPEAERIASLMAEAWFGVLGIAVKIDIVPYRDYFDALKLDDYDVGSTTWIGDFADPYTFLQMWRKDSNLNDARYNDEGYEDLMNKSMAEEGAERWETLAEAEKLLLYGGSVLPIAYSPALNIIDTDEIDGWYTNVLDIHPFKYLSVKARKPLPWVVERRPSPARGGVLTAFGSAAGD